MGGINQNVVLSVMPEYLVMACDFFVVVMFSLIPFSRSLTHFIFCLNMEWLIKCNRQNMKILHTQLAYRQTILNRNTQIKYW